jgi:hypothetical protein
MKTKLTPILAAGLLMALVGGCKKAEQSQSSAPGGGAPTSASGAKGAVLLKAKWPVGNRYVYRMDLDQHSTNRIPQMPKPVQQDVTMAMTYALSVTKATPDDGREVEFEFLANEMEVKMGDQVLLSFDSKEKGDGQNPMMAPYRKMIGSKLQMVLGPDGKVKEVVNLDDWLANIQGDAGGPAGQMLTQQFNEGFFRQLADFGHGLSTNAVAVGQSWPFKVEFASGAMGKLSVDATIAFKGWEEREAHHCAILDSRGTLKSTPGNQVGPMGKMSIDQGKILGRSWFDPELGAMVDATSDQSFRVKGELPAGAAPNPAASGFTSEIGQKVTVKLVEMGKMRKVESGS